ncbi:LOW QUALITY PROTEIN: trafficking protein particle complex II-specific subunit 130 homolog [Dioscorea cayenensis subsp. rotundata]|uniref:LOW QUALITY PROTEIN: trafficking protein particle complex II-specific subunit 130 homolog n=1 Tax=Dioscorea cayennensis subsp. rotundata TaxID=55577 RepID=A0AB40BIN4_DIOCR|nr:LOW QUALITY PROTEIN: trafficking protein particle complex II-specific subunit 130 homolog [Dioscorea cayenensis subsp. rotundata]
MANYLTPFQTIKSSCDRLVIAVEDVSDLWPSVKEGFEQRLPFRKACLNNKTRNPVNVEQLPAEFILTTDSRLRSRFPHEQSVFWFREPYATVVLVTCEDLDEFKRILKPRLKLIVQNDEKEWFIVFVSKAHPSNDQATKMAKKVYAKLEVDFSSKKRERCCKLDLHGTESIFWEDLESKMVESIRNTLDRRVQFFEEEIRKLSEQRYLPVWNFVNFFILKESLAFMFEMAHLHEDSLREYDELELCYLETVNTPARQRDFGGLDHGDDQAALLNPVFKPLTQIVLDDSFREFEFRQYLFACQSKLLFKLSRPVEVAARGYAFIISFSKTLALHENYLPFCLREVWVITACLAVINSTSSHYNGGVVTPDVEKEFYRLQGDLHSLCRIKFMRLAYLIGYGVEIERSPSNSASLSMLPWPRPAAWPVVSPDASSEVFAKEKIILQANPRAKHFDIQRKPLPLEPSSLLREANRRRASLSIGNVSELFDSHHSAVDGSGADGVSKFPPSSKTNPSSMSRNFSGPVNFESSSPTLDRPMRLSEIHVAAEHALKQTISDPDLLKSLSTLQDFEQKYMELTKGAADKYHNSWWKRHGVALDREIAALCFKHGNFDLAAKSYEKVCALYAGEGWQDLLGEVLPNLAECQKILNDQAGYLSSCVRLLSLDSGLFSTKERRAFQLEVVRLAHSEMKHPVPLNVSSLITFAGNPGPLLELSDGDPGTLSVTVWSGFPDDITLESLSMTLVATNNVDEGVVEAIKCPDAPVLNPGRNTVTLTLPPQKPGSYVLGVLTGQIGHLTFRSHGFSKGGPPDSDDFMSFEKPTKPVLKVFKPRPLVDITAAISSALLMNEPQWVGLIVKPMNYSLRGAILHIDPGPELMIEESHMIEIEDYTSVMERMPQITESITLKNLSTIRTDKSEQLLLENGKITLPDWASDITSVLWFPVRAVDDRIARGTSAVYPQRQSVVDGMRTVALKLVFGAFHNQIFREVYLLTIAIHFTNPLHVSTRVVDKCNDGNLLLQVIMHSQVKAYLHIHDAWIDLQDGFVHSGKGDGRPIASFFPLIISPTSRAALLFSIRLGSLTNGDEAGNMPAESILNIRYGVAGDRNVGAHTPVSAKTAAEGELLFKSTLFLQRPVLDPCLAVGFLPFSSDCLRVGQLVSMQWRVERLKEVEESPGSPLDDELLYEINVNPDNWMIAGRKRGFVSLSTMQGSRIVITVTFVPLISGYVRPPQLGLPDVDDTNISCNPAGPHLVCVLPPVLSSSFCVPA